MSYHRCTHPAQIGPNTPDFPSAREVRISVKSLEQARCLASAGHFTRNPVLREVASEKDGFPGVIPRKPETSCYSCGVKKYVLVSLVFIVVPILFAQSDAAGVLPSDPNALLQMAAPHYDYASPDMKPWHIRYHYQYYDENGLPGAEGEFDYWWSTTKVSRASWTHGIQSHIECHTADGKELRSVTGNDIASMEHRLYFALLPGFLKMKDSLSGDRQLKYFTTKYSSQQLACVGSVKPSNADTKIDSLDSV